MDNRLRFLYYGITELWGRMWRAWARNGKPRASEVAVREEDVYKRQDYGCAIAVVIVVLGILTAKIVNRIFKEKDY